MIFGTTRKHLGKVLHELAVQKGCQIVEGHLQPDHVHMYMYVYQHPTEARGIVCSRLIKGKSAISIARRFIGRAKNFTGENFWACADFVSTVGLDEELVRAYIRHQEEEDEHYDQLKLGM